jgi:hypothetical protein
MSAASEIVTKLIQTFERFIFRDAMYVIGGLSVVGSFWYLFGEPLEKAVDPMIKLYVVFVAYIVGYAVQELFTIFHFTTTVYRKPNKWIAWLGNRFAGGGTWYEMPKREEVDVEELWLCVDKHCPSRTSQRIDRIVNLKHIGATLGSSLFITAVFLGLKASDGWDRLNVALAVGALTLSLILMHVSWIKATQQAKLELQVNKTCKKCEGSADLRPESGRSASEKSD